VTEALDRATDGRKRSDLVFTATRGVVLDQPHFYEYRWQRAVALAPRNGLTKTPRFHDLRHTYAAWLISAGVPLPEIQRRLGHESIQTTVDVYGGLLEQAGYLADAAIDAALQQASGSLVIDLRTHDRSDAALQGRTAGDRATARSPAGSGGSGADRSKPQPGWGRRRPASLADQHC
jgi:hypothetical protein